MITAGLICLGAAAQAETVTLELRNGDKLKGELIPADTTDKTIVLEHPVLGRLSIPRTALVPAPKPKHWKLSLSGGLSGSNTDNDFDSGATGQLKVSYTKGLMSWSFRVALNTKCRAIKAKARPAPTPTKVMLIFATREPWATG